MHERIGGQYNGQNSTWRVRVSVAMAFGVHAALLVGLSENHADNPLSSDSRQTPAGVVEDFTWDVDVDALSEAPREEAQVAGIARVAPAHAGSTSPRFPSSAGPAGEERGLESAAPAPSGSAESGWTFSPTVQKPVDLGIGSARSARAFGFDSAPKVDVPADTLPSTTGGLVEALDAADAQRGLGRGGPVKLAVEAAARSTDAPNVGKATFDISVGTEGEIHISLVNASSEFDGWNQLIASIRGHLARKRVRIPPGSKGLHVIVEVEAREQFPDGRSPASLGGKVGMTPTGSAAGYSGKVCGVGISLGGLGGGCSPENAGIAATRVVSSRITRETRL